MKLAVCISGICKGKNVLGNIKQIMSQFRGDLFCATWEGAPQPPVPATTYPEPAMGYHPFRDIKGFDLAPKFNDYRNATEVTGLRAYSRTLHQNKQILAHAYLLRDIPADYDMIIRARYDTVVSGSVDFSGWLQRSYDEGVAVGFGVRASRHGSIHSLSEVPRVYPRDTSSLSRYHQRQIDQSVSQDWGWYIMDPLIMHPRRLFNVDLVFELHRNRNLRGAEFGWYQVLSEPFGDTHHCVYGGATTERWFRGV